MCRMLDMLRDLVAHKGHANAAVLSAISHNGAAVLDSELLALLHHVLVSNRFWLLTVMGLPFVLAHEARPSSSFDELVGRYRSLQEEESAWFATAAAADMARALEDAQIPGGTCTVAEAWMQVCLHSHGHRAQAAKMLRRHGGEAPMTDFILWVQGRPAPEWSAGRQSESR